MTHILLAFGAQSQEGGNSMFTTFLFMGVLVLIFYFMIMRPQQKRAKERAKLLESVKKGDKVITSGGMHGKVVGIDEKTILLDVGDNVKLKFERSAVASVTREASGD